MNAPATQPVSAWLGEFVLLSALWGASFLFTRLGAAEFGPLTTAGLRVALATVFLWPLLVRQGQWPALRRHWRPILLAGVIDRHFPIKYEPICKSRHISPFPSLFKSSDDGAGYLAQGKERERSLP